MATPLSPDLLLAVLRAEGVLVAEHAGWRTHNRNTVGAWGPVNGVLIHHTAASDSLGVVWAGRTGLPGPLAHTHLGKDGTATMVGNGRANHAGRAAANAFNAVLDESSTHPRPSASSGAVDGNRHFYGIEIENLGNGRDPYPRVQYQAALRWAAAICRAHGWTANSVVGHKETSLEGKVDPSFDMGDFRAGVAERLKHPAGWSPGDPPTRKADADMPTYVNLGIAEPYTIRPGQDWDAIEFTKEWTDEAGDHAPGGSVFVRGPARFTGHLSLALHGVPAGAQVQVRPSEVDTAGHLQADHPIAEVIGTEGATHAVIPLTGRIGTGRGMRMRIKGFQAAPITVTSAALKALVWKEG